MIKIMQIRETPINKSDGIDSNCQGLIKMFYKDNELELLPTIDYTKHSDPIVHQHWLDRKEICRSIEKLNPDIVHVHGAYSFTLYVAIKCAKRYGKKVVLSPHFHPFYALKRPKLGKLFFYLITKNILKDVDLVYTINNEDTEIFSRYHNNVVKVPHWSKFEISPNMNGVKKNPKMILFVGRLDETNKGVEHLYYLPEGKYEIHCIGNGKINLRSDMKCHINISDEELEDMYQKASLLVVPSRYEAFSYVTIESMINGTPVVMSDRVRIADHLNGIKGYSVFKFHEFSSFVTEVEKTIGIDVDANLVESIFNPQTIKEIYKKSYLSLL